MLPMNPVESLKCRYIKKNYFSTCQAMTNIFPWHCDAPGIVRWGTNSAWWLCDSSLPWSPAHTGKKGQNNREKSFWPLLWGEPWVSKTSQQFLYSSTGTSAHFKSSCTHCPSCLCGQRGGFSCLTQSCFDTSTSGQQPPFGSRITHRLPNGNNLGIMAPQRHR